MPEVKKNISENQMKLTDLAKQRALLTMRLDSLKNLVNRNQQEYFDFLYKSDREAWIIFDPIISVQDDGTFFEAFSGDESIYAKVFLPHDLVKSKEKPSLGTTNIDFSLLLEREFERVRSYRGMSLNVGLKKVDFKTSAAAVTEEKILLPESWVRGLVEVQSALSLSQINFEISSQALLEVIARLESENEKSSPRSLKFHLVPNSPIRVELEPWGYIFNDDWCNFDGKTSATIRIWGRRRLKVLKQILPDVDKVFVKVLGSGMPSFWTVIKDGVELTIGLSGWTSNDWATKAKFSSFIPTTKVTNKSTELALEIIQKKGSVTTSQLAGDLEVKSSAATAVLQKLCKQGKVMYDQERQIYRWRDLFPTLDFYQENDSSREITKGLKLLDNENIELESDEIIGEIRFLAGSSGDNGQIFLPKLEVDLDGRPSFAQCTCPFFNYNRLREGPCQHMIALILKADSA
jgi:ribosomal protein S25